MTGWPPAFVSVGTKQEVTLGKGMTIYAVSARQTPTRR